MQSANNYENLKQTLIQAYRQKFPISEALQKEAEQTMINGGNHNLRLIAPFPPRIIRAKGATFETAENQTICDFWQGHYTNLFGNNPQFLTKALSEILQSGYGLQIGVPDMLTLQAAEIFCQMTSFESVRFTVSGALASMYAIMTAQTATRRDMILKIGGGWHGSQPWGLKGVHWIHGAMDKSESSGIPDEIFEKTLITEFNDTEKLRAVFKAHGSQIACFLVEPFIGAGGFVPAKREFLQEARTLCDQYGVVLIFDEIISGFRFCAGGLNKLFGIQPDLALFGKAAGGGVPFAAVAGKREILSHCGKGGAVAFSGGTFSAHPLSMVAVTETLKTIQANETTMYQKLADLGQSARKKISAAFASEGIEIHLSGVSVDLPHSSLLRINLPVKPFHGELQPSEINNPDGFDAQLTTELLPLAFLLSGSFSLIGKIALSCEHTDAHIDQLAESCQFLANKIRKHS